MNWSHPEPFCIDITVRPEDCDVMGHANNTSFLRWLEKLAWAHSDSLGLTWERYQELGVACVVHRHELDYLAQTHPGDQLVAGTWIDSNDGRIGMWRGYQIFRKSDECLLMNARTRWVCINLESGKACRMPKEFVEGYRIQA